jgi:hypothetical protein
LISTNTAGKISEKIISISPVLDLNSIKFSSQSIQNLSSNKHFSSHTGNENCTNNRKFSVLHVLNLSGYKIVDQNARAVANSLVCHQVAGYYFQLFSL